jgi:hypothetical protein
MVNVAAGVNSADLVQGKPVRGVYTCVISGSVALHYLRSVQTFMHLDSKVL